MRKSQSLKLPALRPAPPDGANTSGVQVHPDRLRLGEILDRGGAMLAAEAGIAFTAPWQPNIRVAVGVDPYRAGAGAPGEALHAAHVATPDAGGEAVRRAVGEPERLGLVLELDDADDGAEDFLLRDPHLVLHIREHRRADEIATLADLLTAGDE